MMTWFGSRPFLLIVGVALLLCATQAYTAIATTNADGKSNLVANPDWWVAGGTIALAIATVALFVATFLLWKATVSAIARAQKDSAAALRETREANRISRASIQAQQRPWVVVRITLRSELSFVRKVSPGDQARILVRFELENIGLTPAVGARVDAKFIDQMSFIAEGALSTFETEMRNSRPAQVNGNPIAGMTLFPRDTPHAEDHDLPIQFFHGANFAFPILAGWISYRSAVGEGVFFTPFILNLFHRPPGERENAQFGLRMIGDSVPQDELRLRPHFVVVSPT